MKRLIYMALTMASAFSLGGCSTAITTKDLTILEEAENQTRNQTTTTSVVTKSNDFSTLTFDIEGNTEVVSVRNYISSLGYRIKMDEERFSHETNEDVDYFSAMNPDTAVYPEIYIKISKIDKSNQMHYLDELKHQLLLENPKTEEIIDQKIGSYDAVTFKSTLGEEFNSAIKKVSVIETIKAFFTIETQYFIEAEEGYGARIKAILDTFIINE